MALTLIDPWIAPSTWVPSTYDATETYSLPTYSVCNELYNDLSYQFQDASGNIIVWITSDSAGQFTGTFSQTVFESYAGQT